MKIVDVTKQKFPLFNNIGIETAALCNRHCHFCPNSMFKRKDEYMDRKMFSKIIDELAVLKYHGRVELYIYNEPTRDSRLPDFIMEVRAKLPRACIMINTNGDYFKSPRDIEYYFDIGLNQMQINIYSAADKHQDGKLFEAGVKRAMERESLMKRWVHDLAVDETLSLYQNIGSQRKACSVVAKYGVKNEATTLGEHNMSNRSGNIPNFKAGLKEPIKKHCTKPFRFLNINWKGQSLLCCNDYYGETNFGNVNERTLAEIWNHQALNEYRIRLNAKNRNQFLCSGCDSDGGFYPHMVNLPTFGKKKDTEILAKGFISKKELFHDNK